VTSPDGHRIRGIIPKRPSISTLFRLVNYWELLFFSQVPHFNEMFDDFSVWCYNEIWVNYNDLTATSLESWLVRGIIPKWPYFRLVKYYNLPRWNVWIKNGVVLLKALFESCKSMAPGRQIHISWRVLRSTTARLSESHWPLHVAAAGGKDHDASVAGMDGATMKHRIYLGGFTVKTWFTRGSSVMNIRM